jgi:hypothetical protein
MSDLFKVFMDLRKDSGHRIEPDLEQKELAAIGYVTAQWAFLEHAILASTCDIADENKVPLPADAVNKAFSKRLAAWRQLIEKFVTDASKRMALLKIVSKAANLEVKRHQLAHALWSWDEEDPTAMRAYSFRPKVEFDVDFDFNGLIQLGHKIGEINFALSFPGGKKDAWESIGDLASQPGGVWSRSFLLSAMDKAGPDRRPRQGVPRKPKQQSTPRATRKGRRS